MRWGRGDTTYWLIITCSRTNQGGGGRGETILGDALYSFDLELSLSSFCFLFFKVIVIWLDREALSLMTTHIYRKYDIRYIRYNASYEIVTIYSMHCEVLDFWNINVMSNCSFHWVQAAIDKLSFRLAHCTILWFPFRLRFDIDSDSFSFLSFSIALWYIQNEFTSLAYIGFALLCFASLDCPIG